MLLVHYGSWKFDLAKFKPIKNTVWNKPKGGLWTSPLYSEYGWKHFCKSERFNINSLKCRMILKLKSDKILTIDSIKDLDNMEWRNISELMFDSPDYEKLKLKYDAIYLTLNGQNRTRLSHPLNLYGWDVETVFIMNPKSVQQLYPKRYAS